MLGVAGVPPTAATDVRLKEVAGPVRGSHDVGPRGREEGGVCAAGGNGGGGSDGESDWSDSNDARGERSSPL